jgi:hypothetical protein
MGLENWVRFFPGAVAATGFVFGRVEVPANWVRLSHRPSGRLGSSFAVEAEAIGFVFFRPFSGRK